MTQMSLRLRRNCSTSSGGKARLPIPHGFVGELETAQQKHLCQVAQAQFVAQPAQYDLKHDIGGKLQKVERPVRSFDLRPQSLQRNIR
jgi:hypothetical protein